MEMALNMGAFEALDSREMMEVDGGFVIALVAIGGATYAITSGMVVGTIGTAWAIGYACGEIYKTFK